MRSNYLVLKLLASCDYSCGGVTYYVICNSLVLALLYSMLHDADDAKDPRVIYVAPRARIEKVPTHLANEHCVSVSAIHF